MCSKFFLSIFFVSLQLSVVLCQNEVLHCDFTCRGPTVCSANLTIQNPNGFNSFTEVTGPTRQNDIFDEVFTVPGSHSINVPQIICETFKNIYRIGLSQIGLKQVDDYAFRSCKGLIYIFLWGNNISYIHENAFAENPKLYYLALQGNNLKTLPENLFLNQQKLWWLSVEGNPFTDIPKYVFKPLIILEQLYIKRDQIVDIKPEWFETLGMLKTLDLSYETNQIETLPRNVFNPLKNVTYIGLRYQKLTVIHADSFGILISAPRIDFYSNKINAIDVQFIFNTGPSTIYMDYNLCAKLPISDNSTSKELMMTGLKVCFDNYKAMTETTTLPPTTVTQTSTLPPTTTTQPITTQPTTQITSTVPTTISNLPPGCTADNWIERICYMEDQFEVYDANLFEIEKIVGNLTKNQHEIKGNLEDQQSSIADNQKEITSLHAIISGLQKDLETQIEINAELESKVESVQEVTKTLVQENQEIQKSKDILEAKVEDLNNFIKTELQNLEDRILILSTHPCTCQ